MKISKPLAHLSELWFTAVLAVIAVTWPCFTLSVLIQACSSRPQCGARRMGEWNLTKGKQENRRWRLQRSGYTKIRQVIYMWVIQGCEETAKLKLIMVNSSSTLYFSCPKTSWSQSVWTEQLNLVSLGKPQGEILFCGSSIRSEVKTWVLYLCLQQPSAMLRRSQPQPHCGWPGVKHKPANPAHWGTSARQHISSNPCSLPD